MLKRAKFIIFICCIILVVTTIFSMTLFLNAQQQSDNNEIGRGLDNRAKDNIYRDEIFLQGLIEEDTDNIKEKNSGEISFVKTTSTIKDMFKYHNINFSESPSISVMKEYLVYDEWNFYDMNGIGEINTHKELHNKSSYYVVYNISDIKDILVIEEYIQKRLKNVYISLSKEDIQIIKYLFIFNDSEKIIFVDYEYNEDLELVRKDYYKNNDLIHYIMYDYYDDGNRKFEKRYSSDDTPDGKWLYYNKKGYRFILEYYDDGVFFSNINYYYNQNGKEIKREYYKRTNIIKYWIREDNKITYYDDKDNKISWSDFINH